MNFGDGAAFAHLQEVHLILVSEQPGQTRKVLRQPGHGQRLGCPGVQTEVVDGGIGHGETSIPPGLGGRQPDFHGPPVCTQFATN